MRIIFTLILTLSSIAAFAAEKDEVTKPEVTSADFSRLKEAVESKSEKKIVDAISVILSKDPKNLKALNALAVLYMKTDKVGLARLVLERALKDHPKEAALYNNLGVVEILEQDLPQAIFYFRKSIALNKKDNFAMANLASIYLKFGNYSSSLSPLEDSYDDARHYLSRGQEYAVQVSSNYAVALYRSGDIQKAKRIYEKILDGKSRDVSVMLNYAILLVKGLKEKKESLRILSKIKFVSDNASVLKAVRQLEKELDAIK